MPKTPIEQAKAVVEALRHKENQARERFNEATAQRQGAEAVLNAFENVE